MQSTHTPGPWKIINEKTIVGADHPGMGYIADVNLHRNNEQQEADGLANAAFIVRACNAHEEMVNQLRLAQRMLLQTDWRLEEGFMAEIAAAIAKAEGRHS